MKRNRKGMAFFIVVIIALIAVKAIWVSCSINGIGSFETEKKDIIRRANYLTSKVATTPQKLLEEMPSGIGEQFQGEWAIYSCSMTCAALANIAILYPKNRELSIKFIGEIIDIALSEEIKEYDRMRWGEDPMDGIYGNRSHISYYSHVAWMISRYKQIGGDNKYDDTYHSLCKAMNNRICQSPIFNAPTYPGECIYIPDMLVSIVALSNYAHQYSGKYQSTVDKWIKKASSEWIDQETGLLASFLEENHGKAQIVLPVKGSYSALNCYYLSLVDPEFAKEQYDCLMKNYKQGFPFAGIKEAGPIIFNISPSGTAFTIGCATSLDDMEFRNRLLKTAEIGGSTVTWFGKSHYLLADLALVGEAIVLAMRTSSPQTRMYNK